MGKDFETRFYIKNILSNKYFYQIIISNFSKYNLTWRSMCLLIIPWYLCVWSENKKENQLNPVS